MVALVGPLKANDRDVVKLTGDQTWTGTKSGSVRDKGGSVFNVKAYGAVGDGSANDAAAIQAAITAASAAGGGVVFLPPGTYRLTTRIALKSKVSIRGSGRGVSIIKAAAGVAAGVLLGATADTVSDATYEDFTITGDYAASALAGVSGFQVTTGARLTFRRLEPKDLARSGVLLQTGTVDCTVEDCKITDTGLDGNTAGHAVMIIGNSHRNKVKGNRITGGWGMGVALANASGGCTDCEISNNYITNIASPTGFEAIGIQTGCNRAVVSGNQCLDSNDNGISVTANDCTVTGNTVNGALNSGIDILGSRNAVTGNVVKNAGREVSGTAFAGIMLTGSTGASYNTVMGNTIYDDQGTKTQDYAIRETTGANFNLIVGNVVRAVDQLTGAIATVGANSVAANNLI